MNFQEALNQCNNEIGDFTLPIPNSDVENKFILTLLSDDEKAWLGITDEVLIQIDSTFFYATETKIYILERRRTMEES